MAALIGLYFFFVLFLSVYGLHRSTMILRARAVFHTEELHPVGLNDYPQLCVQLPLYNEAAVAERIITAVMSLDYPSDLLEVQVLDDSTDETSDLVARCVDRYATQGRNIVHLQRKDRIGYKAGALAEGLACSTAPFVAVFDADFVPTPDTLSRLLPYLLRDKNAAFVQARWTHLNRNQSLLTRAQALLIDGHFVIEHTARSHGALFNFNGTAGIWRRAAIDDAGGWQGDTITEDLDLSYRAFLQGWKAVYVPMVCCPAELPDTSRAFKTQQYRWMKGAAQVCRKLLPAILRSPQLSIAEKREAFFHLTAHLCYPCMLGAALLLIPVALIRSRFYAGIGLWFELLVFVTTFVSLLVFYGYSQWLQGRRCRVLDLLAAIWTGIGLSLCCARASLAGLLWYQGEFVRTPKSGNHGDLRAPTMKNSLSRSIREHPGEVTLATYLFMGVWYLLQSGLFLTIPFALLLLGGYAFIFCTELSVFHSKRQPQ